MEIRPARAGDEPAWRELWKGYCDFYEERVPEEVTKATWRRLLEDDEPMRAIVAIDGTGVIGFANYVLHPTTWATADSCYLEDLFVSPAARGRGAGRALIEAVLGLAREQGWDTVYWHTRANNAQARALYDEFGQADDFVRYVIALNSTP